MQFARKANKLVGGMDASLRAMNRREVHMIIIANDASERTSKRIINATGELGNRIPVIQIGSQEELSTALGLPFTAIFSICDKQFASKMLEYYEA